MPPGKREKRLGYAANGGTNGTQGNADSCEDTDTLTDIKWCSRRFATGYTGNALFGSSHAFCAFIGGEFGNGFTDHFADTFIGRPDGLLEADGIVDDFDKFGIPVFAGIVHKNTVAPLNEDIVGASGQNGHDGASAGDCAVRGVARAFTIEQAELAHGRHG